MGTAHLRGSQPHKTADASLSFPGVSGGTGTDESGGASVLSGGPRPSSLTAAQDLDLDPSDALLLRVEPTDFTTHRSAAPAAASSRVGPIEKRSIRSAGTPADNYMEE